MARVFSLRNVLELVINRLDNPTFAQQEFISQRREFFYSGAQISDQLKALLKQRFEEGVEI